LFERSARQAIEWIQDTGEKYLAAMRNNVANSGGNLQALPALNVNETSIASPEVEKPVKQTDMRGTAQESKERVKLFTQLADGLVEKGHAHAADIKQWVASVNARFVLHILLSTLNLIVRSYIDILKIISGIKNSVTVWNFTALKWELVHHLTKAAAHL
jgi:hypothetical protein